MTRQQLSRSGRVYNYRRQTGLPQTREKINRSIWETARQFDFGPIISGDQQQTRQLAFDFIGALKDYAKRQNLPYSELQDRLKEISPHIRKGLLNFHSYLDSQIKIK